MTDAYLSSSVVTISLLVHTMICEPICKAMSMMQLVVWSSTSSQFCSPQISSESWVILLLERTSDLTMLTSLCVHYPQVVYKKFDTETLVLTLRAWAKGKALPLWGMSSIICRSLSASRKHYKEKGSVVALLTISTCWGRMSGSQAVLARHIKEKFRWRASLLAINLPGKRVELPQNAHATEQSMSRAEISRFLAEVSAGHLPLRDRSASNPISNSTRTVTT